MLSELRLAPVLVQALTEGEGGVRGCVPGQPAAGPQGQGGGDTGGEAVGGRGGAGLGGQVEVVVLDDDDWQDFQDRLLDRDVSDWRQGVVVDQEKVGVVEEYGVCSVHLETDGERLVDSLLQIDSDIKGVAHTRGCVGEVGHPRPLD